MKETKTYQVFVLHDSLAFENNLQEKFQKMLMDIDDHEYFVTVNPTPNVESKFSATVIIIKESLEDAQPLCNKICNILTQNGYTVFCQETILLWGNDVPCFSAEIK